MLRRGLVRRWSGVPVPAVTVAAAVVLALVYGAVLHLVEHVTGDRTAYRNIPPWLAAYYSSPAVLDPLAAVLLAARTRVGLVLAAGVLVSDAAANGYANLVLSSDVGSTAVVPQWSSSVRWCSRYCRPHGGCGPGAPSCSRGLRQLAPRWS